MSITIPAPTPDHFDSDTGTLKVLWILHYVLAGFCLIGILFLFGHYTLMHFALSQPQMQHNANQVPFNGAQFMAIFKWFYLTMGLVCICVSALNILAATFIRSNKHRVFCIIVAALNCLHFPFGTTVGIFSLIMLTKKSVQIRFDKIAAT